MVVFARLKPMLRTVIILSQTQIKLTCLKGRELLLTKVKGTARTLAVALGAAWIWTSGRAFILVGSGEHQDKRKPNTSIIHADGLRSTFEMNEGFDSAFVSWRCLIVFRRAASRRGSLLVYELVARSLWTLLCQFSVTLISVIWIDICIEILWWKLFSSI